MPYGFFNTPAIFQGYVNKILAKKSDIFVIVYLDDILIYTEDLRQPHVEVVCWVLDQLHKHFLFANLKQCRFHQDEVCFLEYIVLSKRISMKAKKIEVIKDWPEPKLVCNIQVFLGFANFYRQFIQGFSKIAALFTSMLKITELSDKPAPGKNNGSRPGSERNNGVGKVDEFGNDGVEYAKKSGKLKDQKSAKSWKLSKSRKSKDKKPRKLLKSGNSPNFGTMKSGPSFLTPKARSALNRLRLAFTKAPILWHFDPEYHIQIEIDASSYAIGGVLTQLASGTSFDGVVTKIDLGQWHLVVFFWGK